MNTTNLQEHSAWPSTRTTSALSVGVLVLMVVQAGLGLGRPVLYRDVDCVRATWFGNDMVTLLLAAPVLTCSLALAHRGSVQARLVWMGGLAYGIYNYSFYLLGAALNVHFPLYALAVVASGLALILAVRDTDVDLARAHLRRAPSRGVAAYLLFVAVGLTSVWVAMWAAHVFGGRPTPVEPEVFRLVAGLDLVLLVPGLAIGGMLLWRRSAWGYVIAAIASVEGTLYLLVLTTNSWVAIRRGLVQAPGELPMWATLAVFTALSCALLLRRRTDRNGTRDRSDPTFAASRQEIPYRGPAKP